MANIPISNLPAVTAVTPEDLVAIVQGSTTNKATLDQLSTLTNTLEIVRFATTSLLLATYDNGVSGIGATLSNSGVFVGFAPDGITADVRDRILVKNQTNTFENGIYEVTVVGDVFVPWVITRVSDYDDNGEILPGTFFTVYDGTTNSRTQWIQTETVTTIGTDAILFQSNIVPGTGLEKSQNTISLTIPVSLANGGTAKALVADNGGIVYSDSDSLEILASTPTTNQVLLSGSSSAPSWSTATFAPTYSASNLLYSNGANSVVGLTTANSGALVTNNSGVPSILSGPGAAGRYLQSSAAGTPSWSAYIPASSGANSDITSMTGLTGTIQAPTQIASSSSEPVLAFTYAPSSVNYLTISNKATSGSPTITTSGTDASISLEFQTKGSGTYKLLGTSSRAAGLNFYENTTNGTNRIALLCPDSLAANYNLTLPTAVAASNNQPLLSSTTGVLSFGPILETGTYTPTLTNVANVSSNAAFVCQYLRVGAMVNVSGRVDIQPTVISTVTQLRMSLPIASSFSSDVQAGGSAQSPNLPNDSYSMSANVANNEIFISGTSQQIGLSAHYFSFMYQII